MRSEQNSSERTRAKRNTRKENTRRTIRVKIRVFYAMKTERVSLQNKYVGVQPYATANKTKEN